MGRLTIPAIKEMKKRGEKITMLTAYDYSQARQVDQAQIELILVGDSLGMVVLGYEDTVPVTLDEIIHHTKAVARGTEHALVVADLPFMSYQVSDEQAIINAGRLIKEGGAQAVKLEGGGPMIARVRAISEAGIPVMGHLGLTPQTATGLGGFKVQGKDQAVAQRIIQDAGALEDAGAFSLVLECVPQELAAEITQKLNIPVIGIGAGRGCDGQVLVYHDILGLFDRFTPKFVRRYAALSQAILDALKTYRDDVKEGKFPGEENSF